jgi:hypothetical protein
VLVVKQPSLSPECELNRFGIGEDFVIPDHAAVTRQDFRGKVRVDLIGIGVLGQVPFSTEIKAPESVPVRFADLVRDGLRHGDRCGIRLQFPEVSNLALLQIHFQAHRDGRLTRRLFCLRGAAELDSIPKDSVSGLRDRALIAAMLYSFARVSAVLKLKVDDYYHNGARRRLRLHEKVAGREPDSHDGPTTEVTPMHPTGRPLLLHC